MDIKKTVDNINAIREIANSLNNIELKDKIVELSEEMLELRTENINLKEKLAIQQNFKMEFKNNMYWNNLDNKEEGPYCSACWDKETKAIRLHQLNKSYICPICKNQISKGI